VMKKTQRMHSKFFQRILLLAAERTSEFAREFGKESDRGLVVLGGARLDEMLREILLAALRPYPKQAKKKCLLDGELQGYGSRIKACYELGFIDLETMAVLEEMGHIRNRFAHDAKCTLEGERFELKVNKIEERVMKIELYT